MRLYKLDHVVYHVTKNASQLLVGITTNTLDAPYNACVDHAGRIIATFSQLSFPDNTHLIVLSKDAEIAFAQHLFSYVKLAKSAIQKLSHTIYFDLDDSYTVAEHEYRIPQLKGSLIITSEELKSTVSDEEFTSFRLTHNLPLQGIDYTNQMLLNIDTQLQYVSFTKGCFLGQEVLARVHNLAKPPLLLKVVDEDECTSTLTSAIVDPKTQKKKGFCFIKNN